MAAKPIVYSNAPGGQTIKVPLPTPPTRQFSFTNFSQNNPTTPQPGNNLDAEYDRTNLSVSGLISFCSVTFNTDGTLKPGSVGSAQLDPSIADDISNDIEGQLQPLVDNAFAYASSALSSATAAQQAEAGVAESAGIAQGAASTATTASGEALFAAGRANTSAQDAANSATDAANNNNLSEANANLCIDYGLVTQAWAEHMPDTIPPDILAVMNITGDHWSSRWWANQAAQVVENADNNLNEIGQGWVDTINEVGGGYQDSLQSQYEKYLAQFQTLYLGAFLYPPVADAQGNPVATGALYYNIALQAPYVWNGTKWVPFLTPAPPDVTRYIYVATNLQTTFSGPDRAGNVLQYSTADNERAQVFHKGLLLTPTDDYVDGINAIGLITPCAAGDIVQIFITTVPQVTLDWQTVQIDTSVWTTSGGVLRDMNGDPVTPAAASDVFVSVNGVWQNAFVDYVTSSNSIAFTPAFEPDAVTFAIAIVPTVLAEAPGTAVTKVDTSSWVFDGAVAVTFPLLDRSGTPIGTQAVNLLISLNGVWQNANVDYTVANAFVTFTTPPERDSSVFAVSGLPSFTATTT